VNDRNGERLRLIATRHDDDDDDIWRSSIMLETKLRLSLYFIWC